MGGRDDFVDGQRLGTYILSNVALSVTPCRSSELCGFPERFLFSVTPLSMQGCLGHGSKLSSIATVDHFAKPQLRRFSWCPRILAIGRIRRSGRVFGFLHCLVMERLCSPDFLPRKKPSTKLIDAKPGKNELVDDCCELRGGENTAVVNVQEDALRG